MTRTLDSLLDDARIALIESGVSDLDWTLADVVSARRTRNGLVIGELGWRSRRIRFVCVDRAVNHKLDQHGTGWRAGLSGQFALRLVIHPRFGFQAEIYDLITETLQTATNAQRVAAVRARVATERWAERQRSLPDPGVPRRVAVVTSPDSQGLSDFLATVPNGCDVTVEQAAMAGDTAARSVAASIRRAGADADLIVVLRGGGPASSMSWANDERVVAAVAGSPRPVWVAIGHAEDRHLIDLVAHMSFATPTQAAAELRRRVDLTAAVTRETELRIEREAARGDAKDAQRRATTARRIAAAVALAATLVLLGAVYLMLLLDGSM